VFEISTRLKVTEIIPDPAPDFGLPGMAEAAATVTS